MKKFDRLPPGVAGVLKSNATFVDEEGPMREAVLAASPLTKEELLKSSPGAVELAAKVGVLRTYCTLLSCVLRLVYFSAVLSCVRACMCCVVCVRARAYACGCRCGTGYERVRTPVFLAQQPVFFSCELVPSSDETHANNCRAPEILGGAWTRNGGNGRLERMGRGAWSTV